MMLSTLTWCQEKLKLEVRDFYDNPVNMLPKPVHDHLELAKLCKEHLGELKLLAQEFNLDFDRVVRENTSERGREQLGRYLSGKE